MCKYCGAVQNCAYLCNMAVDANYRRRGYGNILLDAADDITKIAGEKDIFLHLRYVANVLLLQHKPVLLHTLCFFLGPWEFCMVHYANPASLHALHV